MVMDTGQETLGFLQKFESRIMLGLLLFAVFAMLVVMGMYVYSLVHYPFKLTQKNGGLSVIISVVFSIPYLHF